MHEELLNAHNVLHESRRDYNRPKLEPERSKARRSQLD